MTRRSPHNARAWNNLGHAQALACRRGPAEEAFRRAMALEPEGYRAAVNLRLLHAHEPGALQPCSPARHGARHGAAGRGE